MIPRSGGAAAVTRRAARSFVSTPRLGDAMPGANGSRCPHCSSSLSRLGLNELMSDHPFDLVCFNDDCPYYARGWTWMEQQYGVKASYRYRVDAVNGFESPVPVWSSEALRDSILPADAPSDVAA